MSVVALFTIALGAAVLCALILVVLLQSGLAAKLALDQPNARSLHRIATPRCGGIGVMAVTLAALLMELPGTAALSCGAVLLLLVSWLDDRRGLPVLVRFAAHGIAALLVALALPLSPMVGVPVAVLAIVWGTNLFNFMDGANGMSAAMTVVGFSTYALAAAALDHELAVPSAALAGAGLGFWYFNRSPARLFLGDVGSIPAGFLMASIGLTGVIKGVWPSWFPWLVFSPFIADASFTLLRRALRGEAVWRAHKEHFYQRLVRSGVSHDKTSLLWFAFMLGAAVLALALRSASASASVVEAGIAAYAALLAVCAAVIERRFRKANLDA